MQPLTTEAKRPPRILVVEDEIIIALGIQQGLQELGYEVPEIAIREEEVEEKVRRIDPDLILLDINLNGKRDGIEIARAIAQESDVPVVFLTAYVDQDTIDRAQKAGCYGYLVKPYEDRELHSTLQMALGRSRVVRELKRSSDWFVTCLNSISDGVILMDGDGRIRFINEAASALAESDLPMAWGAMLSEVMVFPNGVDLGRLVERCLSSSGEARHVEEFSIERGERRKRIHLQVSASPVHDGSGKTTGTVVLLRDITLQKARDEERGKLRNLEALGRLAGGIAHDFNNLLTIIVANTSMIRYQAVDMPLLLPQLDRIQLATSRAAIIANQFLTFARGGAPLVREFNMADVIHEVLADFNLKGRVSFTLQFAPDLMPARADEQQIGQAVRAVVRNAIESIPMEGVVTITCDNFAGPIQDSEQVKEGPFVRVRVQDTGEGIAEENLPRIFDPYFTTRSDHSGLGLSTVHSIISRHGGIVEVTSHPGRGTAVSFLVPASRQALLSVIDHPHAGTAGNQLRVLVMDDEEMVCMSVRRMLESLGCAVSTSSDGEDALGKFREALEQSRPFDAVLLDLIVPRGMGGEEAVRQILKMDPKARVIVASGYSSHPVMSQFRTYGFRAVLQKPFGMNEVKTAFSQIGMNLTR